MKLQEAFMERNDLRKKINRVSGEVFSLIVTEEDQPLDFDAGEKLAELNALQGDLFKLNVAIDQANIPNIGKLQRLRMLDEQIKNYSNIRSQLLSWKKTSSRGWAEAQVIVMVKNYDVHQISAQLEALESERRDLDRALQKANWDIDVTV